MILILTKDYELRGPIAVNFDLVKNFSKNEEGGTFLFFEGEDGPYPVKENFWDICGALGALEFGGSEKEGGTQT